MAAEEAERMEAPRHHIWWRFAGIVKSASASVHCAP